MKTINTKENQITLHTKDTIIEEDIVVNFEGGSGGGTDTSDATATSSDMLLGKTAYVKDEKVTGTIPTWDGSVENGYVPTTKLKAYFDETKSAEKAFYYWEDESSNIIPYLIDYNDTENVTNMNSMFRNCTKLTTVPLLNTSNVTDMNSMLNSCANLTEVPLFDTSNVTTMSYMFSGCTNLTEVPLFDTSNVTIMSNMFSGCTNLTEVPLFDTSNVTRINNMFNYCTNLTKVPLFDMSNVYDVGGMFFGCTNLTEVPLFDFSKLTSLYNTFNRCEKLTTIPAFDVRLITNFSTPFYYCISLKTILMYGMKSSFDISASTQFEASDLVTVMSNCQVITTSQKLTMGSTNLAKLNGVYVKETGVEPYEGITVRPVVICESTDEGAMLATDYFTSTGWTLA